MDRIRSIDSWAKVINRVDGRAAVSAVPSEPFSVFLFPHQDRLLTLRLAFRVGA